VTSALRRASRAERLVLGGYLLAVATGAAALLVATPFEARGEHLAPDVVQGRVLLLLALATLVGTGALAVRSLGARRALRLVGHETWPGLLAGAFVGLVLGAPLRSFLPTSAYAPGVSLLYAAGAAGSWWFAHRVPGDGTPGGD
jgi:hypothetical protein